MGHSERIRLVAPLIARPVSLPLPFRNPSPEDLPALAELLLEAYVGTVDYDGETLADAEKEVESFFDGERVTPLLDCSFIALDGAEPVSAALVCLYNGEPLLAYAYTAPAWKGHGLATGLIQLSINALAGYGYSTLMLFVTVGNSAAERVYAKLGFVRTED